MDSVTNKITAQIPAGVADSEGGIAAGAGAGWMMTNKNGTLSRIDPATNKIVKNIQIDSGSFALAATPQAVWITSTTHGVLTRIDPQTNQVVARIHTGPSPRFLCTANDSVWVLNQDDGTVTRVDAHSNQVIATNVPLTRIDPATNKVTSQFVGPGGDALRVGHGSLWICSFFLQEMWRVKPPA